MDSSSASSTFSRGKTPFAPAYGAENYFLGNLRPFKEDAPQETAYKGLTAALLASTQLPSHTSRLTRLIQAYGGHAWATTLPEDDKLPKLETLVNSMVTELRKEAKWFERDNENLELVDIFNRVAEFILELYGEFLRLWVYLTPFSLGAHELFNDLRWLALKKLGGTYQDLDEGSESLRAAVMNLYREGESEELREQFFREWETSKLSTKLRLDEDPDFMAMENRAHQLFSRSLLENL